MFGIGKNFTDGTKRINIDYKRIEEYKTPFVMTLEVEGKNKLDVWQVINGKKAKEIRERYKKLNRRTSYVDFYKTKTDLVNERGKVGLEFHPRICKRRESKPIEQPKEKTQPKQRIEEIKLDNLYGVDNIEIKYLFADKINEIIKRINEGDDDLSIK